MPRSAALFLIAILLIAAVPALPVAHAQGDPDAWTANALNLRAGPGRQHAVLHTLPPNTALMLEARSADAIWTLGRTTDGAWRGWVAAGYLMTRAGFAVEALPVSDETISHETASGGAGAPAESDTPPNGTIASQELIYSTGHSEYYRITYWSDGLRVTGYLGYPTSPGPHPAIIYNRGGAWNTGALTGRELVPLVESGWVAVGSQYRGNAGSQGSEQFGWDDVRDALNLIPLLDALPNVDASRIGMMGGSRGGMVTYMALKAETLVGTHRIKAAATIGGLADLFRWAEQNPRMVHEVYLPLIGVTPAQDFNAYEMRSAVYWPELINAPLLLQHGGADTVVAPEQSQALYDALVAAGKTAQLIIHPGDDHALSGQLGGYREAQRWFAQYLSLPGDPDRQYDSHWPDIDAVSQWFWRNGR